MYTEIQINYIQQKVSPALIEAARSISLADRYLALRARFPKIEGEFNQKVPQVRQQELVAEYPYPIRYLKSEGGYYRLNTTKFGYPQVALTFEMRQWVTFYFGLRCDGEPVRGGSYQNIAAAEILSRGETLIMEDWNRPNSPWCYTEVQLKTVLSEYFSIFDDLCYQLDLQNKRLTIH